MEINNDTKNNNVKNNIDDNNMNNNSILYYVQQFKTFSLGHWN
jgi:hypothetical protein